MAIFVLTDKRDYAYGVAIFALAGKGYYVRWKRKENFLLYLCCLRYAMVYR